MERHNCLMMLLVMWSVHTFSNYNEYKNGSTDYHDQKYHKTVMAFHIERCSALVRNSNNNNDNDNYNDSTMITITIMNTTTSTTSEF